MWHEYVGNIHLHTTYSDGSISLPDLITAAQQAGLDYLIPTDHDIYVPNRDGWYDATLLLLGEEVHVGQHEQPGNHYLVLGAEQEVADKAENTQALINHVRALGGLGFIAHPFERAAPRFDQEAIPWLDWDVTGYTGISLWNYMSEFKTYLTSVMAALLSIHWPKAVIRGPFGETVRQWDRLSQQRHTPIIGTSDAHGIPYKWGPLRGLILPYPYVLRTINTHILTPTPLTGDIDIDKHLVYKALANGNSFVGYDLLGDSRGFRFLARNSQRIASMGETIELDSQVALQVNVPSPATLTLWRNGQTITTTHGQELVFQTQQRGIYRVQACKRYLGRTRSWVLSNPIEVV